jgi:hypothetical protein
MSGICLDEAGRLDALQSHNSLRQTTILRDALTAAWKIGTVFVFAWPAWLIE